MDIEKLIEQLKSAAGGPEGIKMCHAAATALSTLQIENQALRNAASGFKAENEKLRAELEQARESLDFARTKDAEIVRLGMELEQVKRENETLKHALQNWHEED